MQPPGRARCPANPGGDEGQRILQILFSVRSPFRATCPHALIRSRPSPAPSGYRSAEPRAKAAAFRTRALTPSVERLGPTVPMASTPLARASGPSHTPDASGPSSERLVLQGWSSLPIHSPLMRGHVGEATGSRCGRQGFGPPLGRVLTGGHWIVKIFMGRHPQGLGFCLRNAAAINPQRSPGAARASPRPGGGRSSRAWR